MRQAKGVNGVNNNRVEKRCEYFVLSIDVRHTLPQ